MEFELANDDIESSNNQMKNIWSIIERESSKYGWHYQPFKLKGSRLINFGSLYLDGENYEVSVKYKRKYIVSELVFEGLNKKSPNFHLIKNAIRESKDPNTKLYEMVKYICCTNGSIRNYKSNNFTISATNIENVNKITIINAGISKESCGENLSRIFRELLCVLSAVTNSYIYEFDHTVNIPREIILNENNFLDENVDTLTGENYGDGDHLRITRKSLEIINRICEKKISSEDKVILKACRFYYLGRNVDLDSSNFKEVISERWIDENTVSLDFGDKFQDLLNKTNDSLDLKYEAANVIYVSGIEILTSFKTIKTKNCKSCSQDLYKIKYKVINIIKLIFGEASEYIVSSIYDSRSQFLHSGNASGDLIKVGGTKPILSSNTKSDGIVRTVPPISDNRHLKYLLSSTINVMLVDSSLWIDRVNQLGLEFTDPMSHEDPVLFDVLSSIKRLKQTQNSLNESYPERDFTVDGNIIGDLGEIYAANKYRIELFPDQETDYDGRIEYSDNDFLQIKFSVVDDSNPRFKFDVFNGYYLVLRLNGENEIEEVFNGKSSVLNQILNRINPKRSVNTKYVTYKSLLRARNEYAGLTISQR
ncbi:DUF6998 domain-containing protein [Neolewinella antarctica]|uniref:DUF6998 domain-containing protein n=1 Tax=Neolewinella antarctica TaxID=442734 RepID=A0ABX0XGE9_9BACT|nr:hypothetical protein [Neolewinella antarctica]NJC28267.1 hypothetical protein [Neolewinella antarctica]